MQQSDCIVFAPTTPTHFIQHIINTQAAIVTSTFLLPTTRRNNNIPMEILHEINLKIVSSVNDNVV